MISLIWAMDRNRVIGLGNSLPWSLPADLAYFKKMTTGHSIIMGRKTFESIGRALSGRINIIMTRDMSYSKDGCIICHSIEEALKLAEGNEVFVIGGAEVYSKFLLVADRIYVTLIDEEFLGDVFFPNIQLDSWILISEDKGIKDEKNPYDYYFKVYDRK